MKEMRDIYKDTFIYWVCKSLDINMKELAFIMNKGIKQIELWRKDDDNIPAEKTKYMRLLVENKRLQDEIIKSQKHKVVLDNIYKSDIDGECKIEINIIGLKKLVNYRLIFEER
jgi:hypothetical protein